MARVQESLEPTVSITESIFQEYKERISQALEIESKKLKEKAERDSSQIIARAKEEAEQIVRDSHEEAAEARQESARVIREAREKASQILTEAIEHGIKQAQSEFARVVAEARSQTSQLLIQVSKSVEQVIAETETNIGAEPESIAALIAEAETKLQTPSEIHDKEAEVNWHRTTWEEAVPADSVSEKTEAPIHSYRDKPGASIKESDDVGIFKGRLKLEMVHPFNRERIEGVPEWLAQLRGMKVTYTGSHASGNKWITAHTVDLEQPMPLLKILKAAPYVKDVAEHKGNIVITLK